MSGFKIREYLIKGNSFPKYLSPIRNPPNVTFFAQNDKSHSQEICDKSVNRFSLSETVRIKSKVLNSPTNNCPSIPQPFISPQNYCSMRSSLKTDNRFNFKVRLISEVESSISEKPTILLSHYKNSQEIPQNKFETNNPRLSKIKKLHESSSKPVLPLPSLGSKLKLAKKQENSKQNENIEQKTMDAAFGVQDFSKNFEGNCNLDDKIISKFFVAVKSNDLKEVEEILKQYPNSNLINSRDSIGQTALHWAAKRDFAELAELLIENKANIESFDLVGKTPIMLAARGQRVEVLKLLMRKKANPYRKTKSDICVSDICDGHLGDLIEGYKKMYDNKERMTEKQWEEEIIRIFYLNLKLHK